MTLDDEIYEEARYERENPDFIFEMANYRQDKTGLPMIIWIEEKADRRHGPRLKVAMTHSHKANISDSVSVSIEGYPQIKAGGDLKGPDMKLVRKFILLNKSALIDYWNGTIDAGDFRDRIVKV
jgi:hypothetical protein